MITIIDGLGVGAGKSYYVLTQIVRHIAEGGTTYAVDTFKIVWPNLKDYIAGKYGVEVEDDQFHTFPESDLARMHEVTPPGSEEMPVQVIADECQSELNARDTSDRSKRPFFNWLCQSRHDDTDVLFLSQHSDNVDVQIRRLATYCVETENMEYQYVPLVHGIAKNYFRVNILDRDKKFKQFPMRFVKKDRALFGCYISKSMKGAHIRGGEAVLKKKLKRVKRKLTMMMKFLFGLFVVTMCVVGYCGYKGLQGWRSAKAATGVPQSASSMGTGASGGSSAGKGYAVRTEVFRATDGHTYLFTDEAEYYLGEMSPTGFVKGVQGHVALLVAPEGGLVYVVGADEKGVRGAAGLPAASSRVVSVSNAAGSGLIRAMAH
jgi:hypothetical protein